MVEVVDDEREAVLNRRDILDRWEGNEGRIRDAIVARAASPGGYPDDAAVRVMEEPLYLLMGAVVLFHDFASALNEHSVVRPRGLYLLSSAMTREAERVYRLYHGKAPYPY